MGEVIILEELSQHFSIDGLKILLVLSLSFIIGLEREEKKAKGTKYYFGGVVTFPLIGLMGYGAGVLSTQNTLPLAVGFAVVGGFLLLSYRHKISTSELSGFSNEMSGLITYLLGALVYFEHYWIATTLLVLTLLLLELKKGLEKLTTRIPAGEVVIIAKFLLLTAVILPLVPNQELTPFKLNPYKIWLVVVGVSSISYISYVLQRLIKGRGGILLSGLLGGFYSSTATTVVLSKKSRTVNRPNLYAGSILIASGIMYLRMGILLFFFNSSLLNILLLPFLSLFLFAVLGGVIWSRFADPAKKEEKPEPELKNPLELWAAFLFALIFTVVLILTQLTVEFIGTKGIYYLAALVGGLDVDPFLMGITQTGGSTIPFAVAAIALLVAASSNNLIKGIYSLIFGSPKTGIRSFISLLALGALGLIPILFLV